MLGASPSVQRPLGGAGFLVWEMVVVAVTAGKWWEDARAGVG